MAAQTVKNVLGEPAAWAGRGL